MSAVQLIGVDIGGTKCAALLGSWHPESEHMTPGRRISFATESARGPQYAIGRIVESIEELLREAPDAPKAIGISCGGPLDSARGLVLSPPNLPGWDELPIAAQLSERFGLPARLQNDANACALAEHRFGAGRGARHMIFLTFGTGMGAGLILNNALYEGACGMAGEIGHLRLAPMGPVGFGKAGSFEGFCSGGGIAQLARLRALERLQVGAPVGFCPTMADLDGLSARAVALAADAGDPLALAVYEECGRWLGQGLSLLMDAFNPERIVIGSIFARAGHLLWPEAARVIEAEAIPLNRAACQIVPAALGEQIGDYAALAIAADAVR